MIKRIISAAIGIAVFVAALFLNNTCPIVLNILIALISGVAVGEIYYVTKLIKNLPLFLLGLIFAVFIAFLPLVNIEPLIILLLFSLLFISITLFSKCKDQLDSIAIAFMMNIILPFAFSSLIYLRDFGINNEFGFISSDGIFLIIMTCCGAWLADTGAYFIGRAFGKHKLAESISPKKTIEGFIGGFVFNIIGFIAAGIIYQAIDKQVRINFLIFVLIGVLCAFIGTIGDLFASLIKRHYGVKDYGKIMPGHGGVLDRFDSVMLVAPLMYSIIMIIQPIVPIIIR